MFDKNAKPSPKRQRQLDRYARIVAHLSPKSETGKGMLRAYLVGGIICAIGQVIIHIGTDLLILPLRDASTLASVSIVVITALLTGIGVFDKIAAYGGAGAFVPISGFANAMISPALEFRREGLVLGLGAKLFSIAGPVLVWGISSSVVVGIAYAIFPW